MDIFASVEDVEAGWRTLSDSETARAEVLLTRASAEIITEFRNARREYDLSDEVQQILLKSVCCDIVRRVIGNNNEGGYSSMSQTAGSYSEQITFYEPSGNIKLSEDEKARLGLKSARIGAIRPAIGGAAW